MKSKPRKWYAPYTFPIAVLILIIDIVVLHPLYFVYYWIRYRDNFFDLIYDSKEGIKGVVRDCYGEFREIYGLDYRKTKKQLRISKEKASGILEI